MKPAKAAQVVETAVDRVRHSPIGLTGPGLTWALMPDDVGARIDVAGRKMTYATRGRACSYVEVRRQVAGPDGSLLHSDKFVSVWWSGGPLVRARGAGAAR